MTPCVQCIVASSRTSATGYETSAIALLHTCFHFALRQCSDRAAEAVAPGCYARHAGSCTSLTCELNNAGSNRICGGHNASDA